MKATWEDISVAIVAYNSYLKGAAIIEIARVTKYPRTKIERLIKAVHYGKTGWNILPKRDFNKIANAKR